MAMDLSRILGFGADQPLVDLDGDDEVGAAARTPPSISAASSPSTPSPSFVDTLLGLAPDEGRNVRRSLAGGLSAAAANYDKPAMAAATAGFGGALGGTSHDRKVAMLDRAIRAHRVGDMDEVRRALAELLQAQRASQTSAGIMPNAGAMAPAPTSIPATSAAAPAQPLAALPGAPVAAPQEAGQDPDLKVATLDRAIRAHQVGDMDALQRALAELRSVQRAPQTSAGIGDTQPVPNDRVPDRPQAPGVAAAAAPQDAGGDLDHDAVLHDALRDAGAPPRFLDSGHLVGAANLMAKEGEAPADAYERVVMQAARDGGLVDDDDFHHAFGDGASGEARTDQHRRMSRRLHGKAQTRTAARRQETLKLARAFLALAKLHAIPKLSARRIGAGSRAA